MPTSLPAPAAPRQRPVGFRQALTSAVLMLAATWLLKAARRCAEMVDRVERR